MFKKRVITALVAVPLVTAAVWFERPVPWFTVFIAIWGLLAVFEFYRLVGISRIASLSAFGFLWTLLFILSPHLGRTAVFPILLTSVMVLSLIALVFRREIEGAFTHWVWTMSGILYAGWLLSYLVALRLDAGREWTYLAIFATFATDTAAFLVGRAIGRHKLAPRISPAKTWEGAVAGVFGSVVATVAVVAIFDMPLSVDAAVLLGVVVSVFAQLGGLAMSLFKRNMGAKDSGTLIPGHGGVLDRTDSVVFAAIIVYYYVFAMAVW